MIKSLDMTNVDIYNLIQRPYVGLQSGLIVVNFSSPHPFVFEDGSFLGPCSDEQCKDGALLKEEDSRPFDGLEQYGIQAVVPIFSMTAACQTILTRLQEIPEVDVILVPFPVIQLIKENKQLDTYSKAATIFVVDRVKKIISVNKFCR